ncbi:tetratricopeptide repeat protein [Pseudolysobacter antarcticus]|uniref:protein O-GlcNAc transferase n=1 Tax=Pseudolysobacter antarcticus TaxID=2511995 RepID=A0A411HI79_9GAMM|nr:tetratricopeptide repeat protein [Pseudolysobacter antarcticus]QBB70215.1 tetratricopeptide repeat protein [Pseudolysobacter antarcticus]
MINLANQSLLDNAQAAFARGDYANAYALASACLNVAPQLHQARALRVNAALQLERWPDAATDLQLLLQVMPQHAQFRRLLAVCWLRIGNTHRDAKEIEKSIAAYRNAITIDPNAQDARYNLALLIKDSSGWVEALDLLAAVISAEPDNLDARLLQGELLIDLPLEDEALVHLRYIAAHDPSDVLLIESCCIFLVRAGDSETAVELALRHFAKNPQRWREAANIALKWGEEDAGHAADLLLDFIVQNTAEPAARFRCFLSRQLGLAPTYTDTNELLASRERYTNALELLIEEYPPQRLAQIDLDPALLSWSNFLLAYQGQNDRELQMRFGAWLSSAMRECTAIRSTAESAKHQRPRLVLVSSFFRECTVGSYFLSWAEHLAICDWELIIVQVGPIFDHLTDRFERSAAQMLRLNGPAAELAQAIIDLQADIVLYPELGMNSRIFALAALHLAPIQTCAWGHPVTSGLPSIDVYLSCGEMEPLDAQVHYSERLLTLPGIGTRYLSPTLPTPLPREELGLPENRNLYLVPQSPFKLLPENDTILIEVLRRDPTALFVLFAGAQRGPTRNLRTRLLRALRSVSATPENHLHFFPHGSRDEFLRVNLVCDVMLDSLYWSGGNTTLDALHCGLPVVTCPGEFMRGRQSMAMLRRLGCDELIVDSPLALAESAVALAQDRTRRAHISARIRERLPMLTDDIAPLLALDQILRDLLPRDDAPSA